MKLFDEHPSDTTAYCDEDEELWLLKPLIAAYPEHVELRPGFWVFHKKPINDENTWLDLAFFEDAGTCDDETRMQILCTVAGPVGCLRECRHTNFNNSGYVFYMDFENMRAMLTYLEKYFDGS